MRMVRIAESMTRLFSTKKSSTMLPSPGATSLNASASTSVTTAFGLTRPRKRATPTLGGIENAFASPKEGGVPNKFASPSSVYSEGGAQEGEEQNDVIRFGATSAEVEGEEEEGPDFHEIRLVESPVVKSISNVPLPLARSLSINTIDKAWLGRSISYRPPAAPALASLYTGFRLLPAFTPTTRIPRPPASPPQTPPTLPRAPSRPSTISFASLARPLLATTASQKRRAAAKDAAARSADMRRNPSTSSLGESSMMSGSSSVKYTSKWPEGWYVSALAQGKIFEFGETGSLWTEGDSQKGALEGAWTKQKWYLLISVTTLFSYGIAGTICALVTWFRTWPQADVVIVTDGNILLYITLASIFCLLTSLIGLVGTILNSRPILAVYAFLLWPAGLSILTVGYASYKKESLALDLKLNQAWSQSYDDLARLRIQDSLHCCGYYSPFHEATFSKRCYPRTSLPGCKAKLYRFENEVLRRCWLAAFAVAPFHIINIFVATICANHVNRTFGKNLMPRAYRLNPDGVNEDALSLISSLPPPVSTRQREPNPLSASLPTLAYMPSARPGSGLLGLGMTEAIDEK